MVLLFSPGTYFQRGTPKGVKDYFFRHRVVKRGLYPKWRGPYLNKRGSYLRDLNRNLSYTPVTEEIIFHTRREFSTENKHLMKTNEQIKEMKIILKRNISKMIQNI